MDRAFDTPKRPKVQTPDSVVTLLIDVYPLFPKRLSHLTCCDFIWFSATPSILVMVAYFSIKCSLMAVGYGPFIVLML